ncbi:MAG: hypothetical protein ABIQ39_03170 [Ilumatobacteraceae bacterium]
MFTPWPIVLLVLAAGLFVIVIFVLLGVTILRSKRAERRHADQEEVPLL